MRTKIKTLITRKQSIETECRELSRQYYDDRYRSDSAIEDRKAELESRLALISILMSLLKEDEAYVIQRHVIDGLDWPRIKEEFDGKWGKGFGKSIRTFKNYQRKAFVKMEKFIITQKAVGIDYEAILPE